MKTPIHAFFGILHIQSARAKEKEELQEHFISLQIFMAFSFSDNILKISSFQYHLCVSSLCLWHAKSMIGARNISNDTSLCGPSKLL